MRAPEEKSKYDLVIVLWFSSGWANKGIWLILLILYYIYIICIILRLIVLYRRLPILVKVSINSVVSIFWGDFAKMTKLC